VRCLTSAGGCQLLRFHYRAALDSFLKARSLAQSIGDREEAVAIAVDLSSVYLQMWDAGAARQAAEQGLAEAAGLRQAYFIPSLLLQMGRLHAMSGDGLAKDFFAEGIEAAREQDDVATEARGWDLLGEDRLARGQLALAERALNQAFRLRALHDPPELAFSYGRLGALKLAQGDLRSARQFNERAIAAARLGKPAWPAYLLEHQRGEIRLARGEIEEALADFSSALDSMVEWRGEVLPAMSSLTSANIALEEQIFRSFIETGAEHALRTGDARWAAKTFEALETNRAASLREGLALADLWRKELPPEYWEYLAQLRTEETRALQTGRGAPDADSLHLKLSEMEAAVGLTFPANKDENFRSRSSLSHFQSGLRASELFLSFHLGAEGSYLWVAGQRSLHLYRLAPERQIAAEVRAFCDAVQAGSPDAAPLGERLYAELFGSLDSREAGKRTWFLSLEGALFELPFPALVRERKNGKAVYLIESHSLQTVSGALLMSERNASRRGGWMLGVGDPIYNVADPRWTASAPYRRSRGGLLNLFAETRRNTENSQLGRLVGSGTEVEASAAAWRAAASSDAASHESAGTATVLEGEDARRDVFLKLAARSPAVIHLATHVLMLSGRRDEAFVAFGLGSSAETEFLTSTDIAMLHVPGALVIMTGCATGTGDVRSGAGLLGLTRAWSMAGAEGVIATEWPVEDSRGGIFSRFYSYLQGSTPAEALRLSQTEMIHSGTWQASPSYWASYQLSGGGR